MGIKLPFHRPVSGAHQSRRVDVNLNARQQKAAAFLVAGLAGTGEKVKASGKIVNSPSLAVMWMFDRVAEMIDQAEREHRPILDKYAEDVVEWTKECERIMAEATAVPELPDNPEE